VQNDILCNLQDKTGIPSMLLDSQLTMDVFCNPKMLLNIHNEKRHLVLQCVTGTMDVTKKGVVKDYGTIWCHPTGFANILSLKNTKKKYRVKFDSVKNNYSVRQFSSAKTACLLQNVIGRPSTEDLIKYEDNMIPETSQDRTS